MESLSSMSTRKNLMKDIEMALQDQRPLSIRLRSKSKITRAPDDQEATMAHYGLVQVYDGDNAEVE